MDWDFLAYQSMMLIWCCLTTLCLQMTSGSEWKMRCLRDMKSLEGALHALIKTPCFQSAVLLLPVPGSSGLPDCAAPFHLQSSCFWLPNANPSLKKRYSLACQGAWTQPQHLILSMFTSCDSTAISCLLQDESGSNNDLQQLLCLTALGRSCHSRSYNIWNISCLVITALKEYKLLWKITLK